VARSHRAGARAVRRGGRGRPGFRRPARRDAADWWRRRAPPAPAERQDGTKPGYAGSIPVARSHGLTSTNGAHLRSWKWAPTRVVRLAGLRDALRTVGAVPSRSALALDERGHLLRDPAVPRHPLVPCRSRARQERPTIRRPLPARPAVNGRPAFRRRGCSACRAVPTHLKVPFVGRLLLTHDGVTHYQ
jgi:hypothetical protein